jgi:hypothetical protein
LAFFQKLPPRWFWVSQPVTPLLLGVRGLRS